MTAVNDVSSLFYDFQAATVLLKRLYSVRAEVNVKEQLSPLSEFTPFWRRVHGRRSEWRCLQNLDVPENALETTNYSFSLFWRVNRRTYRVVYILSSIPYCSSLFKKYLVLSLRTILGQNFNYNISNVYKVVSDSPLNKNKKKPESGTETTFRFGLITVCDDFYSTHSTTGRATWIYSCRRSIL